MNRACRIAVAVAFATLQSPPGAFAADFIREELRIAMPAAGPRGLEALLVRADEPGRHPLAAPIVHFPCAGPRTVSGGVAFGGF